MMIPQDDHWYMYCFIFMYVLYELVNVVALPTLNQAQNNFRELQT